jgi:hypothetical protein
MRPRRRPETDGAKCFFFEKKEPALPAGRASSARLKKMAFINTFCCYSGALPAEVKNDQLKQIDLYVPTVISIISVYSYSQPG